MKKIVNITLLYALAFSSSYANETNLLGKLKVEGEVRALYSAISNDNSNDIYATAVGVALSAKSQNEQGFNIGVAFRSTKDIKLLSGEGENLSDELSGKEREYTVLSESYLEYRYNNITLRGGRQHIDTPSADSDDIRMVPNSFEAYTALVEFDSLELLAGFMTKWQGADAGLDSGWKETGDSTFAAVTLSKESLDASVWFYNIANRENASRTIYSEVTYSFNPSSDIAMSSTLQYLKQSQLKSSGIASSIVGALIEISGDDIYVSLAYNSSAKKASKSSLSGLGGGVLFSSMDSMILDEITQDRAVSALKGEFVYEYDAQLLWSYAYGNFNGEKNSSGKREHIVEQNFIVEYIAKENFALSLIYRIDSNREYKESDEFNSQNIRVFTSYSF